MEESYIKKRAVFYLSGYDPRGAKYYYSLYKKEASKEKNISVSKKQRTATHIQTWHIENSNEGSTTHTEYHFLEWDDIIRRQWKKSALQLIKDWFFYIKIYLLGGLFFKYIKKSYRQMEGIFFPFNYMWVSLILIFFSSIICFFYTLDYFSETIAWSATLIFIALFSYGLLLWATKVGLFWLLRIYIFSSKYILEGMPSIETRIHYFAKHLAKTISDAKANGIDEILLVSHSVGTILSIPILSQALQLLSSKQDLPILSILSLGECIPLVTVIPHSQAYQKDMLYLSQHTTLTWVDYTAKIDLACFPQLDFFEDINIECKNKENFHFLSSRFHTLYSPSKYAKIRKDLYFTHFLYMMSADKSEGYNFFTLTSGHQRLKEVIQHA